MYTWYSLYMHEYIDFDTSLCSQWSRQQVSKISEGLALLPVLITSKKPANSTLLSSMSKTKSIPLGCERLQLLGFVFCETDADLVKKCKEWSRWKVFKVKPNSTLLLHIKQWAAEVQTHDRRPWKMCVPVKEIQTLYKQTISVWKFFTDPL